MGLDVAAILKLTPMALAAYKSYRAGNLARNLDGLVRAQFERDPRLGPRATESLLEQWHYLHSDRQAATIIAGLLTTREAPYLEALEIRARAMLEGHEMLELGVDATVAQLVGAVRNNSVAAQKDPKQASQAATSTLLSAVEPLAREETVQRVEEGISGLHALLAMPAPRVLILPASFDEDQQRLLAELQQESESAAARLAEVLTASGVDGLASATRTMPGWAQAEPAAFWRTAGRVLLEAGRLDDAEVAFLQEAETPGAADVVAALMTAARVAEADGRPDDADAHLARARAVDDRHPLVGLFEASRAPTPAERLERCDAVEPATDAQRARKEAQRARALMELGRFDEALGAANISTELAPHGDGPELATLATIWRARDRMPLKDRDDRPLIDAARYQLRLYERKLAQGNPEAAAVAAARAALATAILGDLRAAAEAFDRAFGAGQPLHEEANSTLFEAAITCGDAERARQLLPEEDDGVESKLQRATVAMLAAETGAAAELLDEVLAEVESGELRDQAIRMRLAAAADPAVPVDPALARGLADAEPLVAGVLAQRALADHDFVAARQHISSHDDPPSLAIRVEIAEQEGQLSEAVGLQAALTRRLPSSENLLRLAGLRARAGDLLGAIRDAMRLATDERKQRGVRDFAFGLAAQAASDAGEFGELEDIADRWGELSPNRDDPPWAQAFALARQHRHADALALIRRRELEPDTDGNRHLLMAELYTHGVSEASERLRALRDLSERFNRPIELEQAFIVAVLATPDDQRPQDETLIARFQDAIRTFSERFPESNAIRAINIDEDEDGEAIVAKLAEVQGADDQEAVDARQDAIDGVRAGRYPVAFLAAMVGRSTAETIIRNGAHPLGVFDSETHELEVEAAQSALGEACAVFDETACLTIGLLSEPAQAALLGALPGSSAGQSVRDSLGEAVRRQMGGEQVATMHVLPDGTPQIIEEDAQTIQRVRDAERVAEQIVEKLEVVADRALGDDRLAEALRDSSVRLPAAAAMSALAVAHHTGRVLYSDDRVLRGFARSLGLRAFGTTALIDAMHRRGVVPDEFAQSTLEEVVDLGVWSLGLTPVAYTDAARRGGFDLRRLGRPLLADEALLRANPRLLHNALLLAVLAEEAPDKLESWAQMIVLGYREILGLEPIFSASLLLAAQFDPSVAEIDDAVRSRNSKVARALRTAEGLSASRPELDPVLGAVRRWLSAAKAEERYVVRDRIFAQLDEEVAAELRPHLDAQGNG